MIKITLKTNKKTPTYINPENSSKLVEAFLSNVCRQLRTDISNLVGPMLKTKLGANFNLNFGVDFS